MIPLKLSDIAIALGGRLIGDDLLIEKVSTDSRQIESGTLFIALMGPRFDGHQFIDEVATKGAVALIVSKEAQTTLPQIVVSDTQIALGRLGALVKSKVAPMTAAITGSNGKTTVKEMVATIVSSIAPTLVTAGNFNNEIGVPLTLLRLEKSHQFAVVELGANHKGEIAYTTDLVKPQVALVNNAYEAHIEGFGSLLGVAQAKAEIFGGLDENGVAVINLDSPYCHIWMDKAQGKRFITFSRKGQSADIQASGIELGEQGNACFTLIIDGCRLPLQLQVPGLHNVDNALAAAAVSYAMGAGSEQIVAGLAAYKGTHQRLERSQLSAQVVLIDDSYNANLVSVKAAMDVLALAVGEAVLVLGDMAELGSSARSHHQELGRYALELGIEHLVCVGELSRHSAMAAGERGHHFNSHEQAVAWLMQLIEKQNNNLTILVKGSHSSHMEQVVKMLKAEFKEGAVC